MAFSAGCVHWFGSSLKKQQEQKLKDAKEYEPLGESTAILSPLPQRCKYEGINPPSMCRMATPTAKVTERKPERRSICEIFASHLQLRLPQLYNHTDLQHKPLRFAQYRMINIPTSFTHQAKAGGGEANLTRTSELCSFSGLWNPLLPVQWVSKQAGTLVLGNISEFKRNIGKAMANTLKRYPITRPNCRFQH